MSLNPNPDEFFGKELRVYKTPTPTPKLLRRIFDSLTSLKSDPDLSTGVWQDHGLDSLLSEVGEVVDPSYIDGLITGTDREMLRCFYTACLGEKGRTGNYRSRSSADEVTLCGLKAVLSSVHSSSKDHEAPDPQH